MKKFMLLCFSILAITACGGEKSKTQEVKSTYTIRGEVVYVCTGGSSQRYHASDECRGLCRCKSLIEEISKEEAEQMGRTPCKICY